MPPESDRQAIYDQLREKFLSDTEFRAQFLADPAGTLENALGPLTDSERQWVADLGDISGEELAAQVSQKVGSW